MLNTNYGQALTARELIVKLTESGFDLDLPVLTEGCDCLGSAYEVLLEDDGEGVHILIGREPHKLI